MSRNPFQATTTGAIPIIGKKKLVICPHGHVDELPGIFSMIFPANPAAVTMGDMAQVCRRCVLEWFTESFPARLALGSTKEEAAAEAVRWREELQGGSAPDGDRVA